MLVMLLIHFIKFLCNEELEDISRFIDIMEEKSKELSLKELSKLQIKDFREQKETSTASKENPPLYIKEELSNVFSEIKKNFKMEIIQDLERNMNSLKEQVLFFLLILNPEVRSTVKIVETYKDNLNISIKEREKLKNSFNKINKLEEKLKKVKNLNLEEFTGNLKKELERFEGIYFQFRNYFTDINAQFFRNIREIIKNEKEKMTILLYENKMFGGKLLTMEEVGRCINTNDKININDQFKILEGKFETVSEKINKFKTFALDTNLNEIESSAINSLNEIKEELETLQKQMVIDPEIDNKLINAFQNSKECKIINLQSQVNELNEKIKTKLSELTKIIKKNMKRRNIALKNEDKELDKRIQNIETSISNFVLRIAEKNNLIQKQIVRRKTEFKNSSSNFGKIFEKNQRKNSKNKEKYTSGLEKLLNTYEFDLTTIKDTSKQFLDFILKEKKLVDEDISKYSASKSPEKLNFIRDLIKDAMEKNFTCNISEGKVDYKCKAIMLVEQEIEDFKSERQSFTRDGFSTYMFC